MHPDHTLSDPLNDLRDPVRRKERLRNLTPERRALYERIPKPREEIGPIRFDVVGALLAIDHAKGIRTCSPRILRRNSIVRGMQRTK